MASPASPSGAEFRLDVEKAGAAVEELESVRRKLLAVRADAILLGRADRTADDAVSAEAFTLLEQKADGGPGSLADAMLSASIEVQRLIDQMNHDIAEQQRLDDAAAGDFDRRA